MKTDNKKPASMRPYQRSFGDGFITNRLLVKPKTRGGIIYSALDPETHHIGGGVFLPTWDTTDHLHFACTSCKSVADVLQVHFDANYSDDVKYALFFYLGCRGCGATGQRKVYLDDRPDMCAFQIAYHQHTIYVYESDEKPCDVIELTPTAGVDSKRQQKGRDERDGKR